MSDDQKVPLIDVESDTSDRSGRVDGRVTSPPWAFWEWQPTEPGLCGFKTSADTSKLWPALLAVQKAMGKVAKSGHDDHLRRDYSTLGDVFDACMEKANAEGILLVQRPSWHGTHDVKRSFKEKRGNNYTFASIEVTAARFGVVTRLIHAPSGQWLESEMVADSEDTSPKAIGSIQTYLRRYGLTPLLGLAQADDDAEAASRQKAPERPEKAPPKRQAYQAPVKPPVQSQPARQPSPPASPPAPPPAPVPKPEPKADPLDARREALRRAILKYANGDAEEASGILHDCTADGNGKGMTEFEELTKPFQVTTAEKRFQQLTEAGK